MLSIQAKRKRNQHNSGAHTKLLWLCCEEPYGRSEEWVNFGGSGTLVCDRSTYSTNIHSEIDWCRCSVTLARKDGEDETGKIMFGILFVYIEVYCVRIE